LKFTISSQFRGLIRAVHRDAGYLAVGLTFIYAISGLAVNHIKDWDPNYREVKETLPLPASPTWKFTTDPPGANQEQARSILLALGINEEPTGVYAPSEHELDITLEHADLHVDLRKKAVVRDGQSERFLLKTANFLHLNRGKRAWTFIADSYAILLLSLATSGLMMVKGRKGFWGRGALFVLLGAAVPIAYVILAAK
jgi:uncharacterized protein